MGPTILTAAPADGDALPAAGSSPTRRQLIGCLASVLFALLIVVLGDARVHSGSDAGGKAATVAAMAERGTAGVDLGYWAERADPDGTLHPFYNTGMTEKGWVQVTSAVQPTIASIGQRLLGDFGGLWLPLLAIPLGALGAAALARALGAPRGELAFWLMAFASPLTFYGTDQWEHAPALALALWASAFIVQRPAGRKVIVMALIGAAAVVLRRESVFVLVALAGVDLVSDTGRRHWWSQRVVVAAGAAIGLGVLLLGQAFDSAVLGSTTASRSARQAGRAGTELSQRLDDSILTTLSVFGSLDAADLAMSAALVAGMVTTALGIRQRRPDVVHVGGIVSLLVIVSRLASGLGFVPGAFAALPVALAAPILARGRNRSVVVAATVAALAVLWFQWTGGLAAQWGGRYLLVPAAVWAIVALAEVERLRPDGRTLAALLGATVLVAGLGFGWHIDRTNGIGTSRDEILGLTSGQVVISTHTHFAREIAIDLADERWLLADQLPKIDQAFDVVASAAPGETVWLLHPGSCVAPCERRWDERNDADDPAGWTAGELHVVSWLDGTYVLEAFTPTGPAPS